MKWTTPTGEGPMMDREPLHGPITAAVNLGSRQPPRLLLADRGLLPVSADGGLDLRQQLGKPDLPDARIQPEVGMRHKLFGRASNEDR